MLHYEARFQPIIETSRHEVVGYDCRSESFRAALEAAGMQGDPDQRYFVKMLPLTEVTPELVHESGLLPRNLVLGMAESHLIGDTAHLRMTHFSLRRLGFQIAFDNVGIGTNALKMVAALRPDYIRIAEDVVGHIERPVFAATVRRLVEISEDSDVRVIATGVERPRTVENLWLLGVEMMQGPLFGQPSPQILTHRAPEVWNGSCTLERKGRVLEMPLLVNS